MSENTCMPLKTILPFALLALLIASLAGASTYVAAANGALATSITQPLKPTPGGYTSIDKTVSIKASASGGSGAVSVAFYAGSIPLGTDSSAPYQASFNTSVWPDGQTSFLKVVATDASGATATDIVYVQVVRGSSVTAPDTTNPTVALTAPVRPPSGRYTTINDTLAISATAADNVAVARVQFFAGSIPLGTDTSAPFGASFDTSVWPNGQTSFIRAVASDAAGNDTEDLVYVKVVRDAGTISSACADNKDNDGDGLIDYPDDPGCTSLSDTDEYNAAPTVIGTTPPSTTSGPKLTWAPPVLSNPITITVPDIGQIMPGTQANVVSMDPARDYIVKIGNRQAPGGVALSGGRNVVIIGGRIWVPDLTNTELWKARCMEISNNVGTIHIEGLQFDNCGTGIAVSAPNSTIQLQNVRFTDVDSPWDLMHPDVIQTWRGPKEIRIDKLSADFSSKGFLWMSVDGTQPKRIDQRRVNFRVWSKGGPTPNGPHHFTWHTSSVTRSTCQNCWTETGWWENVFRRRLQDGWGTFDRPGGGNQFIPYRVVGSDGATMEVLTQAQHDAATSNPIGSRQGDYMERLTPSLEGERWHWGIPSGGDFVPAGSVGTGYSSPGYL